MLRLHAMAMALACTLVGASAHAAFIPLDSELGPHTLTLDTTTGLQWLDLNLSPTFFLQQWIHAGLPEITLPGFRPATLQETRELLRSLEHPSTCFDPKTNMGTCVELVRPDAGLFDDHAPDANHGGWWRFYFPSGIISPEVELFSVTLHFSPGNGAEADSQLGTPPPTFNPEISPFLILEPIPEPSTLVLLVSGFAVLLGRRLAVWNYSKSSIK